MNLKITFDVFSGRQNPSVTLDAAESADLLARIGPITKAPAGVAQSPEVSLLGYRGILVEQIQPVSSNVPQRFRIAGGSVSSPAGNLKTIDASIELSILRSAAILGRDAIPADLADAIRAQSAALAAQSTAKPAAAPTAGALVCRCAPLYEPNWWNDAASGGAKQYENNCYNYACNYRTDTFAQPGHASNAMWTQLICANVGPAAVKDGLQNIKVTTIKCPTEGHLVALCMWENFDYHWYRMGRDGLWTHKPGGTPATNLDNSGHLITDPRLADRGTYVGFCGFFVVMHGHIKLK